MSIQFRTFSGFVLMAALSAPPAIWSQQTTPPANSSAPEANPQQTTKPSPQPDEGGPDQDNSPVVLKKKNPADEPPPPPPAPDQEKVKNPKGLENYSIRVDVPEVTVDVSVQQQKTGEFVPGLQPYNFRVYEDGEEQKITDVRVQQKPITAVLLLEFAATNYWFINDMQQASYSFFRSLKPDDYIAVVTYDLRTHILTDFTKNREVTAEALQSLQVPGFSDTDEFDALYETIDRLNRIDGRKYIILISSGRDTFSHITLDQMLAKIKSTKDITIYTVSTGGFVREMASNRMRGGGREIDYLQADNQMRTFASLTGGQSYFPIFQGALPEVFGDINASIRNQYVLTYHPTNPAQDGTYRKIKVQLVDREGQPLVMVDEKHHKVKYSVIARDGYQARRPVE